MTRLSDPGMPPGSFGQNVFELLDQNSLTVAICGVYEPRVLVDTLREKVAYFAASQPLANGFAESPGTGSLWALLDGDESSAVLLFLHPHDSEAMAEVLTQLGSVRPQFQTALIQSGEIEDPFVALQLKGTWPVPASAILGAVPTSQ